MKSSLRNWSLTLALAATMAAPAAALAESATPESHPSCINVAFIDHTRVLDDNTILFFLRGGQTVKNSLDGRCFGLRNSTRGFTYVAQNDEVCGNMQSIRVNDTGSICLLGPFSPYEPAAASPAPAPAR